MLSRGWTAILLSVALFGALARADDSYPFQGTAAFKANGVVTMVDADRDRVDMTGSDGKRYSLDTDAADIRLRTTSKPGFTGDLVEGMYVSVVGRLLAPGIVAVDRLAVLPYTGTRLSQPLSPSEKAEHEDSLPHPNPLLGKERGAAPAEGAGGHVRLRGTVESVDDDNGIVVVDVNDQARTVHVDENTDLSAVPSPDDEHIGLQPGNRVAISGALLDDGSVNADAISPINAPTPPDAGAHDNTHQLVGHVSRESNKYTTRDIKVMLDANREITVHVPHDARVVRYGKPVSVHDLKIDDLVKVKGSYDGDDFNATRIDVVQPASD